MRLREGPGVQYFKVKKLAFDVGHADLWGFPKSCMAGSPQSRLGLAPLLSARRF